MIYIITPVFNRKDFTQSYLAALAKQTKQGFKTIIVDDGSTDGTAEMIEKQFPDVILLKEQGDLWWAEATNIGIRYAIDAGADYVMTLNDDTLPDSNYIEQMQFQSQLKPKALLGAFAVNAENNQPVFGGEVLNWKTGDFENVLDKLSADQYHGLHPVNVFPGRGLLIPVEVFKNIGFYDSKNFPQTIADLDFTARATNAGYEIYCNYDAKIKIYPEESGGVSLRKEKSLKNYYRHLFSQRGAGNLKWFSVFAFKNAPKRYLISYWFIGVARRMGGYLIEWGKELRETGK